MKKTSGFSLFGAIAAIVILAILTYFIAPHLFKNSPQQNLSKVRRDLTELNNALGQYKLDNGLYPTTEQGLAALVTQPTVEPIPQYWNSHGYISSLPVDPWGQAYQYTYLEDIDRVFSYGPGGKRGATEIDLTNIDKP